MKENVLDVLMYLFENYVDEDTEIEPDRIQLQDKLLEAGFPGAEIDKAFDWLENLASQEAHRNPVNTHGPARLHGEGEWSAWTHRAAASCCSWSRTACSVPPRGSWWWTGSWTWRPRTSASISSSGSRSWCLFNQPDQEAAYTWLENMMFDSPPEYLH
jgi:Smg protein